MKSQNRPSNEWSPILLSITKHTASITREKRFAPFKTQSLFSVRIIQNLLIHLVGKTVVSYTEQVVHRVIPRCCGFILHGLANSRCQSNIKSRKITWMFMFRKLMEERRSNSSAQCLYKEKKFRKQGVYQSQNNNKIWVKINYNYFHFLFILYWKETIGETQT